MYSLHAEDYFEDPRFPLTLAPRNPQPLFPLHSHDFSELVLVLGGTGVHFTQEGEYQVIPGDVFFINGELAHGYKKLENLQLMNFLYIPKALGIPSEDLNKLPGYHALFTIEPYYRHRDRFKSRLRLGSRDLLHAQNLIAAMEEESATKKTGYQFMLKNYFFLLVGFLSRCYSMTDSKSGKQRYKLGKVISFMEHHTNRSIRIEELTAISGSSESTLLRDFKRITGYSPLDYHLKTRLNRASRMLQETDYSITQIAFDTGFSDSNYFSRQFRKLVGISPSDYRRNNT